LELDVIVQCPSCDGTIEAKDVGGRWYPSVHTDEDGTKGSPKGSWHIELIVAGFAVRGSGARKGFKEAQEFVDAVGGKVETEIATIEIEERTAECPEG
jgi:hypothetical protein